MKNKKNLPEKLKEQKGFTMVEIIISVVISLIIMAAIFEVFIAQKNKYRTEDITLELGEEGNFAIEYLTRLVQNSGYNIVQGMKIETASDHYFTVVMDDDDNGVIEADEVITVAINKHFTEIGEDEQPTEIVHDPELNNLGASVHEYYFDCYFDMDGDGDISDSEKFVSGYDLGDAPDDDDSDQRDSIKLFLNGPPYGLYRYSYVLLNEGSPYDATTNPYRVNPRPDIIAEDVENFIIRYYDQEDLPLPVTYDDDNNRIAPKPPYVLTREEMTKIRRVEFDLLLKAFKEDPDWNGEAKYPAGSMATYDSSGKPSGWSCGDSDYPPSPACDNLSTWECFLYHCDDKIYSAGEFITVEDNYRRLFLTASVTPKNLILNPYGTLTLVADPPKLRCPNTEVELTATLRDNEGSPISNAIVKFYSTANVSELDFTGVSMTDADGNPITDSDGVVSGIKLRPAAPPGGKKRPVTITVSADSSITFNIDGVDKTFPVFSSVVVPFIVGPPSSLSFVNPPTSIKACDDTFYKDYVIYAVDCIGFEVKGAKIEMSFYDPDNPGTPIPSDVDPGSFFVIIGEKTYTDEAGYLSDFSDDTGKYEIKYEPPTVTSPLTTYLRTVGITATAMEFEDRVLDDPLPDGWGMTSKPSISTNLVLEVGIPSYLSIDPTSFEDSGCRGSDMYFTAIGYDCGNFPSSNDDYEVLAIIDTPIFGFLYDLEEILLSADNSPTSPPDQMEWYDPELLHKARYLVTGCANSDVMETIDVSVKDDPGVPEKTIDASLSQCPVGLNINLRAREPHTTPAGEGIYTDGFFRDGCNYDNLDIEAHVILNIPPDIECEDVVFNPVEFTIMGGDARFCDSNGNNCDMTSVTVNTDDEGIAIIPIALLGSCSLEEVGIRAYSTYGTDPVYEDTEYLTLEVEAEDVVYAYRDYCYTDRLTPANALRTGDYVYIEVRDCCRDVTATPDQVLVKAYEWISGFKDEEEFYLTETGNNTGVFRGRLQTKPTLETGVDNDGVLYLSNGTTFNIRYLDVGGIEYKLYDSPYVQTIMNTCGNTIKYYDVFSKEADNTFFPSGNWSGFSGRVILDNATYDPLEESYKGFIIQDCDELILSAPVPLRDPTDPMNPGLPANLPIPTTFTYENNEVFAWVDFDEEIVGEENSESEWRNYDFSLRFKYHDGATTTGFADPDNIVPDHYFPEIDNGVIVLFRVNITENEEFEGLTGDPELEIINSGYAMVWTKDTSGDPLLRLYRITGLETDTNPVGVSYVQIGSDITVDDFNIQYDDGHYHEIEGSLEDNEFWLYADDVFLDFDSSGGASATDRNYISGTFGFGVKNDIVIFDNVQVCGCPPMEITSTADELVEDVPVTLTLVDLFSGFGATPDVNWSVEPFDSGTFSVNPSTTASTNFTWDMGKPYPEYIMGTDYYGCSGIFYPTQPTIPCYEDDWDDQDGSRWNNCDGTWEIVDLGGGDYALHETESGGSRKTRLDDSTSEPYWMTHGMGDNGDYDNYAAEIDIKMDDDSNMSSGGTLVLLLVRFDDCSHYYCMGIRNESTGEDGGYEVRLSRYNGGWNRIYGEELGNIFDENKWYNLYVEVIDQTFHCVITDIAAGTVLSDFTHTDTGMPISLNQGSPGMRVYRDGATFNNFKVCPVIK